MQRPVGIALVVVTVVTGGLLAAGPWSSPAAAIPRDGADVPLPSARPSPLPPAPSIPPGREPVIEIPPAAALVFPDPPPCRSASGEILLADVPATARKAADWARTLVDPLVTLGRNYVPPDLVPVGRAGIAGGGMVRQLLVDDLRALDRAARAAGVHLRVVSAYRSYQKQQSTFAHWVAVGGYRQAVATSARPGHSEHQLGTVIDFGEVGRPDPWNQAFATTKAGRWLLDHAAGFGFVESYPAGRQDEVCYDPEPWHFRYVGRANALAIAASGLSLRTWLWRSSAEPRADAGPSPAAAADPGAAPSGDPAAS
jgi:D-alanyl-D-alanine carboxypeptidase